MEKRIAKKINNYFSQFKNDIKTEIMNTDNPSQYISLLKYVMEYENLQLTPDDFKKRKRIHNIVPLYERCRAKRATGEQCTRRKKQPNGQFCGTHVKGTPHGTIDLNEVTQNESEANKITQVEVWAQDIQGIIYYIDHNNNVYRTEDVISGTISPKVIAKYKKEGDEYTIPELGI